MQSWQGNDLTQMYTEQYQFGFNGMEKDNETYGEGNEYNFDARIYDPRLGRWLGIDPVAGKYPHLSPYHFGNDNPIITIDPNGEENIVVVGGNTTKARGGHENQYSFMESAIKQAKAYQAEKSTEKTTIVIMNYGYSQDQMEVMKAMAVANGLASPVFIDNAKQLVDYINTGSTQLNFPNALSTTRQEDPITDMAVFSHGTIGAIELSYNTDNYDQANRELGKFDAPEISQINGAAFGTEIINGQIQAPQIDLYSCNSATCPTYVGGKSVATALNEKTGAGVKAFEGRTNYALINNPKNKPTKEINPNGADRLPVASPGVTEVNLPATQ